MKKAKRIAAMTAALLICSGVVGYMPQDALKISGFTANAARDAVAESVEINETNFPDAIFRQYVADNFDKDGDGVLYAAELEASIIKVDYKNISDLTGIEHFKNLKMLTCINNNITNLDLSKNTKLKELVCYKNQIETINIANCTELEALWCYNNKISSIDISNASKLKNLWCSENELTILDASNNTALESLRCDNNKITRLEISDNATLTTLNCENNQLTTFNISNNTALTNLSCNNNQLENLDVSNNTALINLSCNNNLLTTLDISTNVALEELYCGSNRLASLDVSNNTVLRTLDCYENSLTSLDLSNITALTNLSCYGNQLKTLDLSNNVALKYLYCGSNELTTLDVSTNTALEELYFFNNKLKAVDVSKNTALKELNCQENQLPNLDINNNTALEYLHCGSNYLTSLDVSNNTVLKEVWCDQNQLTTLDLSNNTALTELHCGSNQFTVLDISNNTALKDLWCDQNQLTTLDLSKNTALTDLHCDRNQLTSLDVSNTSDSIFIFSIKNKYEINLTNGKFDLSTLPAGFDVTKASEWTNGTVNGNILTVEDASKEVTYKYDCGNGKYEIFTFITKTVSNPPSNITEINETNFPDAIFRQYVADNFDTDGDGVLSSEEIGAVAAIEVNEMGISDLTGVQYFENLKFLHCRNNNLTEIDVTKNINLTSFVCSFNKLTTLDVSNNKKLNTLFCNNNQLAFLDLYDIEPSTVMCHDNAYEITSSNTVFDLSTLPKGFDITRASDWTYSNIKDNMLNVLLGSDKVTYTYDCGNGESETFTLITTTVSKPPTNITGINEIEFPDDIFRQYVADNLDTDDDGVLSATEIMNVTEIRVSKMGISDLTGVGNFINLDTLVCEENNLTALDLSNNKKLTRLYCDNNQITSLDLKNNTALEYLFCVDNSLSSLDLSNNKFLYDFDIGFNDCEITLKDNTFDLSTLPKGFDVTKASEWENATVDGNILTFKNPECGVLYQYDCGNGISTKFGLYPVIFTKIILGDISGDGSIDSSDATLVLSDYAVIATGGKSTFTAEQAKAADVNGDGKYDSIDASIILAYYAYTSTGGTGTIEEYLADMN